ncbi:MAG: hypothetical protein QOE97_1722, partial [Pseudonocardiales bacterium]|nr:hypothetical protein [Pseudonocardiales bacterium]
GEEALEGVQAGFGTTDSVLLMLSAGRDPPRLSFPLATIAHRGRATALSTAVRRRHREA